MKPDTLKTMLAVGAVWIFWGSTFAGMKYAVATMPPFAMASIRFCIAGAALLIFALIARRPRPTLASYRHAAVTGAALLLLGNGLTAWTVQYLPTGINSLILSLSPIWMTLIAYAWGGERPSRRAIGGMLLGFAGMAMLLRPWHGSGFALFPALIAVCASIFWSFGSIYQRRNGEEDDLIVATALQMLAGGILLALEAALFGQWQQLRTHPVSPASLGGLAWLVVFGSLFAYSAYLYTMRNTSTTIASTYAYVNPIVSVALGIVLFHERFTAPEGIAGALVLGGVALMIVPAKIGELDERAEAGAA